MELLEALEKYGIDMIATLLNEIYGTGHIPPGIFKSIFIALPTECELHRKVSLMSREKN